MNLQTVILRYSANGWRCLIRKYRIQQLASKSTYPKSDGLYDRGEYFIGIGLPVSKKEVYRLGHVHSTVNDELD